MNIRLLSFNHYNHSSYIQYRFHHKNIGQHLYKLLLFLHSSICRYLLSLNLQIRRLRIRNILLGSVEMNDNSIDLCNAGRSHHEIQYYHKRYNLYLIRYVRDFGILQSVYEIRQYISFIPC